MIPTIPSIKKRELIGGVQHRCRTRARALSFNVNQTRARSYSKANLTRARKLTIAKKINNQHLEKKIKLSQITLYLNRQKQTCAQVVYFNQHQYVPIL